jgi:hypothetical protein
MDSLPLFSAFAIIWNNSRLKSSAVGILLPPVGQILAPTNEGGSPAAPAMKDKKARRPDLDAKCGDYRRAIAPATVAGLRLADVVAQKPQTD